MKIKQLAPDVPPSFSWDRNLTCRRIRELIDNGSEFERHSTLTWVLREAPMDEMWYFITPEQVYKKFQAIEKNLGRRKEMLRYILRTWHELGKF
jgi:hypothetical protein